ncbi:MAG TPA: TonB-dependent receptor [Calditrichia bacterium]|nr:TonB-dependent receptor [Calditrichia bacterium]
MSRNAPPRPQWGRNSRSIIYLALAGFFGLLFSLAAQENIRISGWVMDRENGQPIEGVTVNIPETPFVAMSDSRGYFALENVPSGRYRLHFSRMDYQEQWLEDQRLSSDLPLHVSVEMRQRPLPASAVSVEGRRPPSHTALEGEVLRLSHEDLREMKSLDLRQVLISLPGVEVLSESGGRSRIVIHGSRGNQVLVLLDGQRLNDAQEGSVDLDQIPLDRLETVEVLPHGNTALFGSHAFAGVVRFTTRQGERENLEVGAQGGSFRSASGKIAAEARGDAAGLSASYSQDYARQNFEYAVDGETFRRQNAWQRNRQLFSRLDLTLFSAHRIKFLVNRRSGENGIPSGYYEERDPYQAVSASRTWSLQGEHQWFPTDNLVVHSLLSLNRISRSYRNSQSAPGLLRYDYRQTDAVWEGHSYVQWQARSGNETRLGFQYLREDLDHRNLLVPDQAIGRKMRDSQGLYAGVLQELPWKIPGLEALSLRGAARYETVLGNPAAWYPALGISLVPGGVPGVTLSAGWARAVRYPDFNSLFWRGDSRAQGNPDLRPERNSVRHATLRFQRRERWFPELSLYAYREEVRDLIFWHQGVSGIWEPRNEERAVKSGLDLQAGQNLWPGVLRLGTAYSFAEARNLNPSHNLYQRQIVFIPRHTLDLRLIFNPGAWRSFAALRAVGERQVTAANTGNALPPYRVVDFGLGRGFAAGALRGSLELAMLNAGNTSYDLLRGYPMPARTYQITVDLQFQGK